MRAALKVRCRLIALLVSLAAGFASGTEAGAVEVAISVDLMVLQVRGKSVADVEVRLGSSPPNAAAMLGSVTADADMVRFTPVLPFVAGQKYRIDVRHSDGQIEGVAVTAASACGQSPAVRMKPDGAVFPANALKFYLHFSEPMEQGVFLDRLQLLDERGQEVVGPFRETELWSPDGKRLTVWFHPGRQKTGVNLNVDEGPVLRPGRSYSLIVAGVWRSARGIPLGKDVRFSFAAGEPDHECPDPARWQVDPPKAGTSDALRVVLGESVDPAVLVGAIGIRHDGQGSVAGKVEPSSDAAGFAFVPLKPWQPGRYELRVASELEDLAGNNLVTLFEVDLAAPVPVRPASNGMVEFTIEGQSR